MYELYIGNKNYSSWSLRPWVLLRAHGIPFVEHVKPFARGSNFDAFRAFSPSGKVPCLRDGATVVWDSLGISEFLAERHPGLWPADATARLQDGALEGSNVSPVETMVAMISAARQFEAQMRMLQTAENNEKTAAQLLSMS